MGWRELLTYWRTKCRDGLPPSRADLEPIAEIPTLLKHVFLFDVVGDQFRYRLIGSFIVDRAGRDCTGKLLDERLMPKRELDTWLAGLRKVATTQRPVLAMARPSRGLGVEYTAIVMPLVARDGKTEMIFGGLFGSDARFERGSDLERIHGLVEYGVPDDLDAPLLFLFSQPLSVNRTQPLDRDVMS